MAEAGDVAGKNKEEERGRDRQRRKEEGERRKKGGGAHRNGHERLGALRVIGEGESVGETEAAGKEKIRVRTTTTGYGQSREGGKGKKGDRYERREKDRLVQNRDDADLRWLFGRGEVEVHDEFG